ncbi:MAG TPA: fumarylacetoacetase [Bryobacteraceae bacterium]|nr:fumarylacetoacetase [Bryobacteraceae bacterium]
MIGRTHNPELHSWVESANAPDAEFPIQNLPYGTFRHNAEERVRLGVAIGDQVLDMGAAFGIEAMETVMAMPHKDRARLRLRISEFLTQRTRGCEKFLTPLSAAVMQLPCRICDYTDFYASIDHATNVGRTFRPDNPLLPNYKWIPVAYHGRSSSIVVTGTPVRRPWGQIPENGTPVYAPSRRLDYELEVGAFLGPGNAMGQPIPIGEAEDHLFGVCLLNDWSARDIQAWEYQPLGPFLAKNFATSISPWIVTREALEPFRRAVAPRTEGDPEVLPHLKASGGAYGITLQVWLRSAQMREKSQEPCLVSEGDFSRLYWTFGQMIAHHTSNGCPIRAGDLIGSGTVSGPEKRNCGCLLEMTSGGAEPLELPSGEKRQFLEDGDEIILRGWCAKQGFRRIGLGECRGLIASESCRINDSPAQNSILGKAGKTTGLK